MNQFRLFPLLSTRPRLRWLCLLLVSLGTPAAIAAAPQEVLGYGVRGCPEYVAAFAGWEAEEPAQMIEYQRYREWLSGLVTGLSLATGSNVLHGVEVEGAMRRVQIHCEDRPEQDMFVATMALIRELSALD